MWPFTSFGGVSTAEELVPGQEYHFTMVISLNSDSNEQVEELTGGFIPDKGDTIDSIREGIISQYLEENRHVDARKMFVVSFSYD